MPSAAFAPPIRSERPGGRWWLTLLALPWLAACQAQLDVDLAVSRSPGLGAVQLALPTVDLLDSDEAAHSFDGVQSTNIDLYAEDDAETLLPLAAIDDAAAHYRGIRARFDLGSATLTKADGTIVPLSLVAQPDYVAIDVKLDDDDQEALILSLELPFSLLDHTASGGDVELRPVLRAVLARDAAEIRGTIARSLVEASDCRAGRSAGSGVAVYAYAGTDVTPSDYFRSDTLVNAAQPIALASVDYDADDDAYRYALLHLEPGSYTLAWTCEADAEQPDADDNLQFRSTMSLSVASAASISLDFTE